MFTVLIAWYNKNYIAEEYKNHNHVYDGGRSRSSLLFDICVSHFLCAASCALHCTLSPHNIAAHACLFIKMTITHKSVWHSIVCAFYFIFILPAIEFFNWTEIWLPRSCDYHFLRESCHCCWLNRMIFQRIKLKYERSSNNKKNKRNNNNNNNKLKHLNFTCETPQRSIHCRCCCVFFYFTLFVCVLWALALLLSSESFFAIQFFFVTWNSKHRLFHNSLKFVAAAENVPLHAVANNVFLSLLYLNANEYYYKLHFVGAPLSCFPNNALDSPTRICNWN